MQLAPDHAGAPAMLLPVAHRVRRVTQETRDTCTLELVPADGSPAMRFAPGQFNMLYAFGAGEVPISISGESAQAGALLHTIRDVGPVTAALCRAEPGSIIGVRGPYGTAWPVEAAAGGDVLFVAGGIGLAPLRPAIEAVLARRDAYARVCLLQGARTPDDLLYPGELDRWRRGLTVKRTVDRASSGWRGRIGVVTRLLEAVNFEPDDTHAFVCGPEVMMRLAARELLARGIEPQAIHVSLERNMQCGVGLCGHCQMGPELVCTSGPVFPYPRIERLWNIREL